MSITSKRREASGFSSWCVCELLLKKLISVLTAPSHLCCVRGRSSRCNVWGSQGFSYCGARSKLGYSACAVFLDQERSHVPCVGRWILAHWSARKALWAAFWWKFSQVCEFAVRAMLSVLIRGPASLSGAIIFVAIHVTALDSVKQTFYKSLCISSLKEMVTGGCVNPGGAMIAF